MSHQDSMKDIVVNHQTIKQVVDRLMPAHLFASMHTRAGATWKTRMLAVAAILWALSGLPTLKGRFEQAQKIVKKVFRWQPAPGTTYRMNAGHNFVIRVGGNVKVIKKLGFTRQYDHTVYLWPNKAMKKNQRPLVLRLVVVHNGKHPHIFGHELDEIGIERPASGYNLWGEVGN